jgi:superfamily II DNA/RNA helicase
MIDSFSGLGISESLAAGLVKMGITTPTGIQAAVIPSALFGKDVIGRSATGTGKTLAFLLSAFQRIDAGKREMQAIILAPTHELAMQIYHQIEMLAINAGSPVKTAPIIGQVNIMRQIDMLKGKPHIIVGSSGRILELINKRKINAQTVRVIIIDEADRMLDDTNWVSVKAVVKATMRDRQMLLFSATLAPAALARAKELTRDPEVIALEGQFEIPADISHMYIMSEQRDKIEVLRKLAVHLKVERALIFINKSEAIETTVMKLNYHGLTAAGLYGTSVKADRQKALESFRTGKVRFLVASDLAARGLDIPGVPYVFNLELPEDPQTYLHRVGRTGRAGQGGTAISIVTRKEAELLPKFEKILKIKMAARQVLQGRVVDSQPKQKRSK